MKLLRIIKKWVGKMIRILYRWTYKLVKVDPKLVIFIAFHGRGYSDNPRAIYEAMRQDPRFEGYRFIWFIKKHKQKQITIPGAEVKEYFSFSYFYYMSKAKYWIINCKMPTHIAKKEEQVYLQTWHGTPLKRLAHDIEAAEDMTFYRSAVSFAQMTQSYDIDVARYNYMISPNPFCTEVFQSAFRIQRERLIETGYPRNDFICNTTKEEMERLKEKYRLPKDKKIVLYAPTWRDNSYVASGYTFELKADFHKWKEILGEEYIVVFKPHYLIINTYEKDSSLQGFLYSIPAEADIRELYVISDMLITDYSSVFFDYAILKRPIYFYMYDIEEYANDLRGFYLDIHKDLPGDIYTNEDELLAAVKQDAYDETAYQAFYERFCSCEDGNAAKRVIDIVFHKE